MRQSTIWGTVLALILALGLPGAARGVSSLRQELTEASHSKANLDRGAELFETCAACHGPDGGGTRDGQVPRIAGQHRSVLIKQLVDYRHDRRWDPRMENFSDRHHLPDAQSIADVAAYISELAAKRPNGEGNGELRQSGARSYARLCSGCHGALGQGEARGAIPRLAGQHYEYLRRQFYDAVDGRRPNFPPSHIRLLARFDHDGIEAVADYLSGLHAAGVPDPDRDR